MKRGKGTVNGERNLVWYWHSKKKLCMIRKRHLVEVYNTA